MRPTGQSQSASQGAKSSDQLSEDLSESSSGFFDPLESIMRLNQVAQGSFVSGGHLPEQGLPEAQVAAVVPRDLFALLAQQVPATLNPNGPKAQVYSLFAQAGGPGLAPQPPTAGERFRSICAWLAENTPPVLNPDQPKVGACIPLGGCHPPQKRAEPPSDSDAEQQPSKRLCRDSSQSPRSELSECPDGGNSIFYQPKA